MVTVRVRVVSARNLLKKDAFRLSDPYARVCIYSGPELLSEQRTRTEKKTHNPRWDTLFIFEVDEAKLNSATLIVEVYDSHKLTRDNFLGRVDLMVLDLPVAPLVTSPEGRNTEYLLKSKSTSHRVKGHLTIYADRVGSGQQPAAAASEEADQSWMLVEVGRTAAPSTGGAPQPEQEEPLPAGWEARTDAASGRKFYVDHVNRRTQWERPASNSRLPPHWEERIDSNGRTFYVNHATRTTQWERPSLNDDVQQRQQNDAEMYRRRHAASDDDHTVSTVGTPSRLTEQMHRNSAPELNRPLNDLLQQSPTGTPVAAADDAVGASPSEEPLPPGWAQSKTAAGRVFYIDHINRRTTWHDPRRATRTLSTSAISSTPPRPPTSSSDDPTTRLGALPPGWEERVHTDGRVFYIDHNNKTTTWEDPRLAQLGGPAVPYSRDYKQKYSYFKSKLKKPSNIPNKIDIKVSRSQILEDSYRAIAGIKNSDLLKARLWIEFHGERGLDYGGVAREWFYLLSKEMFNPYYGLFQYSALENYTLQINPQSGLANESHLSYFKFIGRVAGMAVFHGKLLDGFFIRPFYKMMLEKELTLKDMESVDLEYYNSLKWIVENDLENTDLDLTFSVDDEQFGKAVEVELKKDGKQIKVTNLNKQEYIRLIIQWRFANRIEQQMKTFMEGFDELIPRNLIKIFDENELELLLCGIQDIDVNDWKQHTAYKGEYSNNHPVIRHFWKALYSLSNEDRARLLQFVTGTSRVPMNGFSELLGSNGPQVFTIEKWGAPNQLPRSHTCFNRLDLPPYSTYEELRKKLLVAIENTEGFEGVD